MSDAAAIAEVTAPPTVEPTEGSSHTPLNPELAKESQPPSQSEEPKEQALSAEEEQIKKELPTLNLDAVSPEKRAYVLATMARKRAGIFLEQMTAQAAYVSEAGGVRGDSAKIEHQKYSALLEKSKEQVKKTDARIEQLINSDKDDEQCLGLDLSIAFNKVEIHELSIRISRIEKQIRSQHKDKSDEEIQELIKKNESRASLEAIMKAKVKENEEFQKRKDAIPEREGLEKNPVSATAQLIVEALGDKELTPKELKELYEDPIGSIQGYLMETIGNEKQARRMVETLVAKKVISEEQSKDLIQALTAEGSQKLKTILLLSALISLFFGISVGRVGLEQIGPQRA